MKRNLLAILIATAVTAPDLLAQTASEAFRYAPDDLHGTARNMGAGNSMFAIGPDVSAITQNPSGLAGFRRSEFSASVGFNAHHYDTSLEPGRVTTTSQSRFALPNASAVTVSRPASSDWKTSNFAVGFNRIGEYARRIEYSGNALGSMTDSWRENAFLNDPDDLNGFEEGLAYSSGAIYDFEGDKVYETDYQLNSDFPLYKQEYSAITGGKSEVYLAYAANFQEILWIGASANVPIVNFTEERLYEEYDDAGDAIPFFNNMAYTRYINTSGYGFNGKFGITIKPSKALNIAVSAHTPNKLILSDNFNTTVTYDFTDDNHDGPILSESPYGSFEYALRIPWKWMGGIGVIAGKQGFLGASVTWTDYAGMRYDYSVRGNGNAFETEERNVNKDIQQTYTTAFTVNMGGELALEGFRLRAGIGLDQSPYINDRSMSTAYHGGIGYRWDAFYMDVAYRFHRTEEGFLPYETKDAPQPVVRTDLVRHRFVFTLGVKL